MNKKVIVTVNEGVPYGQPTSNQARYKDPVKVKPWNNVLDATVEKGGCTHLSLQLKENIGSEDCLYNNIHTPNLASDTEPLRAVVVNIHPGGFNIGCPDPSDYGSPDYVMHHDIVYVCIAYRIHIAGFLNLNLKECSGNQALKDIILGLKWIKDNIEVFGGDPENITLLGASSGGTLIHCLMLSPAAKGLFHKAILMCSYVFNPTRITREDNASLAVEGAHELGYDVVSENDKKKLLSFYKKIDFEDTFLPFKAEKALQKNLVSAFPNFPFNPTVDRGENAVLPVNLRKLIDSTARIPIIFGICEKEAVMGFCRGLKASTMSQFKNCFRQSCWGWAHHMTDEQTNAMFEEIKSFYLNGDGIEKASLSVLIDILTDGANSDVYDTLINLIAKDLPSSVYVYKFEYESQGFLNTLKDQISFLLDLDEPINGTFHMSEFSYWACMLNEDGTTKNVEMMMKKDREMIETFTKFLATFAKTGDPNNRDSKIEWKPSTPENPCYLSINNSLKMVDGKLNGERMKFWEYLKKKYGKPDEE